MTTPTSRGELGDEIRRRRKDAKMTQADLAKLAAVATTNVGKIERGDHVSATTVRAIARALDLPATLTDPYLAEGQGTRRDGGLSEDERALIRALSRRGWPAEDIAEALDELRRSGEPRSGTES